MPIVRAKVKPIEEIPEGPICCEAAKRILMYNSDTIFEVDTDVINPGPWTCPSCGRRHMQDAYPIVGKPDMFAPISLFDFDEGIA